MSSKTAGKKWPYIIGGSILAIIAAAVLTVIVAIDHPVQLSNDAMLDYHHYDAGANDIINAKIAFDKLYDITLSSNISDINHATLTYKVVDKRGQSVDNAEIILQVTHPFENALDKVYESATYKDGAYHFTFALPKEGRWNFIAKVVVGDNSRFYNVKADTRQTNTFEY